MSFEGKYYGLFFMHFCNQKILPKNKPESGGTVDQFCLGLPMFTIKIYSITLAVKDIHKICAVPETYRSLAVPVKT